MADAGILNYDRQRLRDGLRRAGHAFTDAEMQPIYATIAEHSSANDLWTMLRSGFTKACYFLRAFVSNGFDLAKAGESASAALAEADRVNPQRNANEAAHAIRDQLLQMGGKYASVASLVTGDISRGNPAMAGNIRDQNLEHIPHTTADLQRGTRLDANAQGPQPIRYAVADATTVEPQPLPAATTGNASLTRRSPSA